MATLSITSDGYSDVDNIYITHNDVTEETDTIIPIGAFAPVYRKLPSVLSNTNTVYTWDDIQYANNGSADSPTFVHLATNGTRPNTSLDTFLMFTADNVIKLNTSECEIFARCELYAYKDNSGDNLLIFTYKSTENTDCAQARKVTRLHTIEDYVSGAYHPDALYSAHVYKYNVNEGTITDIRSAIMPAETASYYSVLDSCCSNESGITLITGYTSKYQGNYWKYYQIININFNGQTLTSSVLHDYGGADIISEYNSLYPSCFFRCVGNVLDFTPYSGLRLYSFEPSNNVLYFVPLNVIKYFILDMNQEYNGRCIVTMELINDESTKLSIYDSTRYLPERLRSTTLSNRELSTLHQVNTELAKDEAGGLQTARSTITRFSGSISNDNEGMIIDAVPNYVHYKTTTSTSIMQIVRSSYWYRSRRELRAIEIRFNTAGAAFSAEDYNKPLIMRDEEYIRRSYLRNSVARGRAEYILDTSTKYAVIPFNKYFIILYSNGISVIIG